MKIERCFWVEDYTEEYVYDTDCDNRHEFIAGGINENGYKFCPYCGKKIKQMVNEWQS